MVCWGAGGGVLGWGKDERTLLLQLGLTSPNPELIKDFNSSLINPSDSPLAALFSGEVPFPRAKETRPAAALMLKPRR